jgi:hypothetical protein
MAHHHWIITLSPGARLSAVLLALEDEGFAVAEVFEAIGSIAGAASEDVARRAREIPGVVDVSPDSPIDIGPPDSPVAW